MSRKIGFLFLNLFFFGNAYEFKEYSTLILNVHEFWKTSSLFVFSSTEHDYEEMEMMKSLPKVKVTVTEIAEMSVVANKYEHNINPPLFVVFLTSEESMEQLTSALDHVRSTFPKWLLICDTSKNPEDETLRSQAKEIFRKLGPVQMITACDESEMQRWKWYSQRTKEHGVAVFRERRRTSDYNLHGKALNVSVYKGDPFSASLNVKFYNNVLEILVKRMNFTIGHIFRENGTMSFLVNNSWTGPIGRVASKQADVAVAPLTISTSRLTVCDFTTAVYREGVFLHVKKPGRSPIPWFSLFEIFHTSLWIALGVSMIVLSISFAFTQKRGMNCVKFFPASYFQIFGIFCQQGTTNETPKRSSSKIIMITAFCTAYLLHASYSALVFGQIAGQTSRLPFSDLETLAIDGSYKLTVRKGGAYEERINEKKSLKKLLVKDLPDSEQAALRQVCSSRTVFYNSRLLSLSIPCDVVSMRIDLSTSIGLGLPKNSPYTEVFNYHIHKMQEDGTVINLWRRTYDADFTSDSKFERKIASPVQIEALTPLFLMLLCACALALVILCCQIMFSRCRRVLKERKCRLPVFSHPINVLERSQGRALPSVWDLPGTSGQSHRQVLRVSRKRSIHPRALLDRLH